MRFGVWGLGFGVWGLEVEIWGFGFKVYGFRFELGLFSYPHGRMVLKSVGSTTPSTAAVSIVRRSLAETPAIFFWSNC